MHALECLANAQLGRKDSELLSESHLADHEFLQDIGHGIGCEIALWRLRDAPVARAFSNDSEEEESPPVSGKAAAD